MVEMKAAGSPGFASDLGDLMVWVIEGGCLNIAMEGSLVALSEGDDSLLEGLGPLDVGVIPDTSSAVAEELLVDALEGGVLLATGLLDSVLVVLVVLVLG